MVRSKASIHLLIRGEGGRRKSGCRLLHVAKRTRCAAMLGGEKLSENKDVSAHA